MSREEYKRLGDYIRMVDVRNRNLEVTKPSGINIDKYFMPSVANIIGTDLSSYKIVNKNQFACNLMHVGRDGRIPIAINNANDFVLVSPAYYVFEIQDESILLPKYLMMWFCREEFDREASFYTDADVRGGMPKDALLNMTLPIPPIEQQQKIVAEYETLSNRIRINEQMIAKLEETAQALYRKMFVDGIDKENLPEGWRMGTLGEVVEIKAGGDAPQNVSKVKTDVFKYPVFANGFENEGLYGYADTPKVQEPSITISARGTIGYCCIRKEPYIPIVRLIVVIPNDINYLYYLGMHFKTNKMEGDGSVQGQLTVPNLIKYEILIPPNNRIILFNTQYSKLNDIEELYNQEINKLKQFQSLLLARMGQQN